MNSKVRNFRTVCGVIAFFMFFFMLGAVEPSRTTRSPFCLARSESSRRWVCGLCFPTWPARSNDPTKGVNPVKYSAKTLTPVQVGQVVKALVLLGARKIIVEEVEKDRFVVTTTTEAAHSKKA